MGQAIGRLSCIGYIKRFLERRRTLLFTRNDWCRTRTLNVPMWMKRLNWLEVYSTASHLVLRTQDEEGPLGQVDDSRKIRKHEAPEGVRRPQISRSGYHCLYESVDRPGRGLKLMAEHLTRRSTSPIASSLLGVGKRGDPAYLSLTSTDNLHLLSDQHLFVAAPTS